MILSNKQYDVLKWVVLILLPASSVFYLALADTWGLPYHVEIPATIAAIDVFLAALLGISSTNYRVKMALLGFDLQEEFGNLKNAMVFSKSTLDVLTWIAQIFLPSLATLYYALSGLWGLPAPEQVVATIMAIDTFLGMLIGFSTSQFHKNVALNCIPVPAGANKILDR